MKRKNRWRALFCAALASAICLTSVSPVRAAETDTSVNESTVTEEPERLEPDAYFEPIQTDSISGWPAGPAVWAESAVVMDLDSDAILYSKNMDVTKYPASITKILTALLAIENSDLHERVSFSENAIFGIERNSSHIGIRVGEVLSMEECLYGIMLESANEVCLAVAEHISGSTEAFVAMMNQRVQELGCTGTNFTNPNGLPDENHYTTARDMALIAKAAYENPVFRKVIATDVYGISTTNQCGERRWLSNHHKMLPDKPYAYSGCTGGKTGFTQAALNTLVTYAERDGRRLVCVSLRTNGAQVYTDTAAMLDYGFQQFQNTELYNSKKPGLLVPPAYHWAQYALDTIRPTLTITLPVSHTVDEVLTETAVNGTSLSGNYLFNGYLVGQESMVHTGLDSQLVKLDTADAPVKETEITKEAEPIVTAVPASILKNETMMILGIVLGVLILLEVILIIIKIRKRKAKKARKARQERLRRIREK